MKKIIVLFSLFFTAYSTFAQKGLVVKNSKNESDIILNNKKKESLLMSNDVLVLTETEFDFGKIPQGKPVTHVFEILNEGQDSLKIENVQASCGCTTPDWERNKIQAPKQKTAINVGYNAAGEGIFTKTITISYNGSQTKQITIKGEVWKGPLTSIPENKELINLKDQ